MILVSLVALAALIFLFCAVISVTTRSNRSGALVEAFLVFIIMFALAAGAILSSIYFVGTPLDSLSEEKIYTVRERIGGNYFLMDTPLGNTRIFKLKGIPNTIQNNDMIVFKNGKYYRYFSPTKETLVLLK